MKYRLIGFPVLWVALVSLVGCAQVPVPLINQPLVPDATAPGGPAFTLTVNGTGFVSGCVVDWNGTALATTFVNKSQLTAAVPVADITTASTAWVTVVNPAPGGTSNMVFFPIALPSASVAFNETNVATASGTESAATGDFNGDGILDLAVSNYGSGSVSVLLGNGDGTFQPHVDYAVGSTPSTVVVGDFNRDGKLDFAVCVQGSNTVAILLGNGDGTFQPPADFATGGGTAARMVAGDFNGDGNLDLATTNSFAGTVSILLGNGDGTFQQHVDYAAGSDPLPIAVGDVNGDGILDLVVGNRSSSATYTVLLGNGDGTFKAYVSYPTISNAESVVLAGFNGDDILDLAVFVETSGTPGLAILLGNGDGTFQGFTTYATGCGSADGDCTAAVADLNGDGILDLAARNSPADTVSVLLGSGGGTFQSPLSFPTGTDPEQTTVGDFNGDGRLDLVVANLSNNYVSVLLQVPPPSGVTLSPASLNFGNQTVGTPGAPQNATLTNDTTGSLTITGISVTGADSGDYSQTNNCGTSLGTGTSCMINVTFKPSATGTRTATLTVTDSDPSSPQTTSLTGTGTQPAVTLSPASLNFGNQPVGTSSAPAMATLTNSTANAATITGISITGANSGDYSQTNNCGTSLGAGASCSMSVTFTPTAAGSRTATLQVTDSGPGSPQTASLTGTGTQPAVTLSPTSLSFPWQFINTSSSPLPVTLTNSGNGTLSISSVVAAGPFSQMNACGSSLGAGSSCTINVVFQPTSEGTFTGSVTVTDNAPGSPQVIGLTGQAFGKPRLSAGIVGQSQSGTTLTATLQITDDGTGAAQQVSINQIGLHTLSGTGTVTLTSPLPVSVGNVAIGASTDVTLTLNVPATVKKFSLTEKGTLQNIAGYAFNFAEAEVIYP